MAIPTINPAGSGQSSLSIPSIPSTIGLTGLKAPVPSVNTAGYGISLAPTLPSSTAAPTVSPIVTSKPAQQNNQAIATGISNITTGLANQASTVAQNTAASQAKSTQDAAIAAKTAKDTALANAANAGAGIQAGTNQPVTPTILPASPYTAPGSDFTKLSANDASQLSQIGLTPGSGLNQNPDGTYSIDQNIANNLGLDTTGKSVGQVILDKQTADAFNQHTEQLQSLANGTFPLTPAQQSQITALQNQYAQLEQQQKTANANYQGGVQVASGRAGLTQYSPIIAQGQYQQAVSDGITKIQNIESEAASKVAALTDAFQQNDFKLADSLYQDVQKSLQDKQTELNNIQKATSDYQDNLVAYNTAQQNQINNLATEAAKNGAPQSVLNAISESNNFNSALSSSEGYLQTATGVLGDYLQYKRDTAAKGLVPTDFQTYQNQQTAKANKEKINEIYATANAKAAADKAAGVLSTQESSAINQVNSKLESNTQVKGFQEIAGQLSTINGIPSGTTDPVQQSILLTSIAHILSPASNSLRGALNAIDPSSLQSGAYNLLNSAAKTIEAKGTLSPDAVNQLKGVAQSIYNAQAPIYDSIRQAQVDTLKARGVSNADSYITNYADISQNPKAAVNAYVTSNPKQAETIAKLYEVPGATDADIYGALKSRGLIQ